MNLAQTKMPEVLLTPLIYFVASFEILRPFSCCSNLLRKSTIVGHFEVSAPAEVHTYSSGYGIGTLFAHLEDRYGKGIASACRLLSPEHATVLLLCVSVFPSYAP